MMTITGELDFSQMANAFASLRKIPLSVIVKNASKDFAQEAFRATPLAKISKSPWYYYDDKGGTRHYLHENTVAGRKRKSLKNLHKVRIKKGYSKSTWIGVFRGLGMSTRKAGHLDSNTEAYAASRSGAIIRTTEDNASIEMFDKFAIDNFHRGDTTAQHERIRAAGFRLASERLKSAYEKEVIKAWK